MAWTVLPFNLYEVLHMTAEILDIFIRQVDEKPKIVRLMSTDMLAEVLAQATLHGCCSEKTHPFGPQGEG
jgi:hypothetical protein